MSDTAARATLIGLRAKLAPLLRMLSSDNEGECANAARAINRSLKSRKLDWHDLIDALFAEPSTPKPAPGATSWKRSPGAVDLPRQQLLDLLDLVEQRSPFLPVKAAGFVSSLRERALYRSRVHLSAKQWDWLQDLLEATGV